MGRPLKNNPARVAISETLRRANLANIITKLKAGKTLSRPEQDVLDAQAAQEAASQPGRRLNKKMLAEELGISRPTLDEYLNRATAPQPDAMGTFSVEETAAYISRHGVRAISSEEMKRIRMTLLRIQAKEAELDLAVKQGELVAIRELEPDFALMCNQLVADLRAKFEFELPARYVGKNAVECEQMNADGIDYVLTRLKAEMARHTRGAK